jgi:hypothetical protein
MRFNYLACVGRGNSRMEASMEFGTSADLLTFYWFESGSRDSCACDVFVREVMMSLGTCLLWCACAG